VIVAGGGPAGAATAILLCEQGIDCLVINEGKKGFIPGESLAPNSSPALHSLGAEHILQSPAHIAYTGNTVVWGSDEKRSRYFFKEPYGNGWHLDRPFFERQLRTVAEERGAYWREGWRIHDIKRVNEKMLVTCSNGDKTLQEVEAEWVVDCSGRASIVARKSGVRKQTLDRLTAFCFVNEQPHGALTGISFIEAVEDGWWYAAPVSQDKVIVNFMTDSDLQYVNVPDIRQWILQKLKQTKYLQGYVDITTMPDVRVRTATTAFLESPSGPGWIAVGDALCSYDPLTSFGITAAIAGNLHAVLAVKDALRGKTGALREYAAVRQRMFNKCVGMLAEQYRLEQRWSGGEFWRRRH
jgi:flavin-dependent dehydrogenase